MKTKNTALFTAILFLSFTGCRKAADQNAANTPDAKNSNAALGDTTRPTPQSETKTVPTASESDVSDTKGVASGVTLENFNKLSKGMNVSEVRKIIDSEGKLLSEGGNPGYKMSMYQWKDGKNNISCMFQNDVMISKTQFGL